MKHLQVETVGLHRRLTTDYTIYVKAIDESFTIPKGFTTDYSSSPWFYPVDWRKQVVAGVLHDWLYKTGQMTRREADALWYHVVRQGGPNYHVGPILGGLGWLGLRAGGWVAWRRHRAADGD